MAVLDNVGDGMGTQLASQPKPGIKKQVLISTKDLNEVGFDFHCLVENFVLSILYYGKESTLVEKIKQTYSYPIISFHLFRI